MMARIKKGDTIAVLGGKDKGKTGKVLQVWPASERALVERINMVKHFERRTQQNQSGGIIEREGSISLAKLAPLCPKCQKPVRVGWKVSATAGKQRICRSCESPLT
jgi:large subunit ribosomal protein L24